MTAIPLGQKHFVIGVDIPLEATNVAALAGLFLSFLVIAFLCVSIFRRRRHKSVLDESELQAIFDHTIELIFIVNIQGMLVRANRSAWEFCCHSEEKVIGCLLWETPWWNHDPALAEKLRIHFQVAARGQLVRFESRLPYPNRRFAIIDFSLKPLPSPSGQVQLLILEGRDVTHQKETENQLLNANRQNEESLALLATLQKAAPIGLGFVDLEFRYVRCNDALAAINGLPAADHIGKRVWEVVRHIWPQLQPHYEKVRSGGGPVVNREVVSQTMARPDTQRTWHVSYYPVMIREEIIGTGIIVNEITEQKQVELALRSSESRSRAILQALPDLMLRLAVDGTIVDFSATNSEAFGVPANCIGRQLEEILPGSVSGLFRESLSQTLESRQSQIFEYQIELSGRQTLMLEARMVPSGAQETITLVRNITERKSAEATIEQERLQLAGIINSAMDGIITIDESRRIVVFNAAAEKIFNYAAEEMIGHPIDLLIPESFPVISGSSPYHTEDQPSSLQELACAHPISGLRANGQQFPIEVSISQITLNGRKLFTLTCRDVTERVQSEETRKKLEAQLLQSQKMEAIGLLAGGVAHDFNNLLTVISSYTEALLESPLTPEKLQESARAIQEASSRAASLTRQLLVFGRRHVSEVMLLNVNTLVAEAEKMLRRVMGEDIHLHVSLDPSIGYVNADPNQVNQVLMNLVVNARDAMPKGGSLTIETRVVNSQGDRESTVPLVGKYLQLRVADTGTGMTPEVKARIFEPFFTTKGVGRGTGLGLAVVHGIVEQSGGRIHVESQPGSGTTFSIDWPIVSDSPASSAVVKPAPPPHGSETILLVEDDESVRKLASVCLMSHGYRVVAAIDGQDALSVLENCSDPIDLLLTDVVMPNMDGIDLARILHTRMPALKILLMSGYPGEAIHKRSIPHMEMTLLQKPYTPLALLQKVREVLDRAGV